MLQGIFQLFFTTLMKLVELTARILQKYIQPTAFVLAVTSEICFEAFQGCFRLSGPATLSLHFTSLTSLTALYPGEGGHRRRFVPNLLEGLHQVCGRHRRHRGSHYRSSRSSS